MYRTHFRPLPPVGEVPSGLVMLDELRVFDVSHNEKLNGYIPEKGLGKLRELISLNFSKVRPRSRPLTLSHATLSHANYFVPSLPPKANAHSFRNTALEFFPRPDTADHWPCDVAGGSEPLSQQAESATA